MDKVQKNNTAYHCSVRKLQTSITQVMLGFGYIRHQQWKIVGTKVMQSFFQVRKGNVHDQAVSVLSTAPDAMRRLFLRSVGI
jgi:hypothetical protein